jgi:ribosomal protein L30E
MNLKEILTGRARCVKNICRIQKLKIVIPAMNWPESIDKDIKHCLPWLG